MSQTVNMPKLGFDMAEGTLIRWVKLESDEVHRGDVLAEIETDKATVEVESTYDGIMYRHLVDEGRVVPVGEPIAIIAEPGEKVDLVLPAVKSSVSKDEILDDSSKILTIQPASPAQPEGSTQDHIIKTSPLAKRLADELGLDLEEIKGSGPGGRIVKRDVEAINVPKKVDAFRIIPETPHKDQPTFKGKPQPPIYTPRDIPEDEHVPLSKLRSIIGRRMIEAKQQVPHFYVTHAYEIGELILLREKVNSFLLDEDKISINDFIVKATGLALRKFPNLNTSIKGDEVVRHGHINIGIAVALEDGLLIVVCRDVDIKPLRIISKEIREMVFRTRQGKMRTEDIEGSTFSISNLGMYDVEHFVAIINPPEAAILAVGSASEVPLVIDGKLTTGIQMKATLSADHRITDGAEAAQFLRDLSLFLEEPTRLLL